MPHTRALMLEEEKKRKVYTTKGRDESLYTPRRHSTHCYKAAISTVVLEF